MGAVARKTTRARGIMILNKTGALRVKMRLWFTASMSLGISECVGGETGRQKGDLPNM